MTSKNNYPFEKNSNQDEKKSWTQPIITEINVNTVKQQEEELYLQMLADQELFLRITSSFDTPN